MGILKNGLTVNIAGYITIFLFTFVSSVHGATINLPEISFTDSSTIAKDTLQRYIKEANTLWNQEESDLEFSFQLLSTTAENKATPYYNLASKFYFWSINNANFIPTHINPQTSVIIKSTGKEKVTFPRPLNTSDSLLISDILIGRSEKENDEARIPLSPSLDMKYD